MGISKPEGMANNTFIGTPSFMAPERFGKAYGRSVDIYAFGLLFWCVCQGSGSLPAEITRQVNFQLIVGCTSIDAQRPERGRIPQSCWELMEKCWNKNPEDRPNFEEVVRDLEQILRYG